jgi:hypothetical protein
VSRTESGDTVITHLAVEPVDDGQGVVNSEFLRSIRPSEIVTKVQAKLDATATASELLRTWGVPDPRTLYELRRMAFEARRMQLKRGSTGFPDSYYRGLAFDYLEQRRRGRGVLKRLARMYDREEKTIRDHLNRAKARDYLTGGGHTGKPSYAPGPKLYDVPQPPPSRPSVPERPEPTIVDDSGPPPPAEAGPEEYERWRARRRKSIQKQLDALNDDRKEHENDG